jgi:hypothetical protein
VYAAPKLNSIDNTNAFLNVHFEREKFTGPVRITMLDLPDGVTSGPVTVSENTREWPVRFTIRYNLDPVNTKIRVRIESVEWDEISTEVTIPLEITKKKEPVRK